MTETPDSFTPALPRPCPRSKRAECDRADLRTPARRNLADALVARVGHKHVAARIDGHATGIEEAGAGPAPVGISKCTISRKR